jgi:hypothetical protein
VTRVGGDAGETQKRKEILQLSCHAALMRHFTHTGKEKLHRSRLEESAQSEVITETEDPPGTKSQPVYMLLLDISLF